MSSSNPTDLLTKVQEGRQWPGKALVCLPLETGLAVKLSSVASEVFCWHHDFSVFNADPHNSSFGLMPPQGPFNAAFFYLPKSKDYQKFCLNLLAAELAPKAAVLVVGPKNLGAGSAAPILAEAGLKVISKHFGRHCVLWESVWEGSDTSVKVSFDRFPVSAWDTNIEVCSLPGVFSHGRLDNGTACLLEVLQNEELNYGSVLDWGCGTGVLGCLLKKHKPDSEVVLTDINAMALKCADETASVNELQGVKVLASDGFSHLEGMTFDLMVSNPPAHRSIDSDLTATRDFLQKAGAYLKPNGTLYIVANAHLPYHSLISKIFGNVRQLSKNRGFSVWAAKHPI